MMMPVSGHDVRKGGRVMEQQVVLHRPWTCRWGNFGCVVVPGRETTSGVFWSCAHPALPPPRLLRPDTCTECPRWDAASRLAAERETGRKTTAGVTPARLSKGGP